MKKLLGGNQILTHHEYIEAVEVRTEDTVYLVKVGKRLVQAMEKHEEEEEEDDDDSTNDSIDIDALNEGDLEQNIEN